MRELSHRQREVMQLLCEGETRKGIADRLGISVSAVRNYIEASRRRLGSKTTLQAVATYAQSLPAARSR